jgi:hypothetical protein
MIYKLITKKFKSMKKLFLLFLMSLVVLGAYSQTKNSMHNKTTKKLTHQQKIDKRDAKEDSIAKIVDKMVNDRQFILKPTNIKINQGQITDTKSELSFLAIDSNRITIRMEPNPHMIPSTSYEHNQSFTDPNWLAHSWIEEVIISGTISKFEVRKQKKSDKGYSISLDAITERSNSFNILINITRTGKANAIIDKKNLAISSQYPSVNNPTFDFVNYLFPIYYNGSLAQLERSLTSMDNSLY